MSFCLCIQIMRVSGKHGRNTRWLAMNNMCHLVYTVKMELNSFEENIEKALKLFDLKIGYGKGKIINTESSMYNESLLIVCCKHTAATVIFGDIFWPPNFRLLSEKQNVPKLRAAAIVHSIMSHSPCRCPSHLLWDMWFVTVERVRIKPGSCSP